MKNYLLALALLTASVNADVPERLIDALCIVESNNDPKAIGDNSNAYGILQIWDVVVLDVNTVYGTRYTHADAFDPVKAREICRLYLNHYCTAKRMGRTPTLEDYARTWNGGPQGTRKAKTLRYWKKVSRVLK